MWASYDDVANRWVGGSLPSDEAQVTTLIDDAEDTILREFPDIQERITAETLRLTTVIKVVARMVIRHLRNPTGQRSTTQGAGPFQQSVTFGGDEPGSLYLTDADRNELAGPRNYAGKAGAIDLTPATFKAYDPEQAWYPL